MLIIKKDKKLEIIKIKKIIKKIENLKFDLNKKYISTIKISKKIISGIYNYIDSKKVNNLLSETIVSMISYHPDYGILASRVEIKNLQKKTSLSFFETVKKLYRYINSKTKKKSSLINDEIYKIIKKNSTLLNKVINYKYDFNYNYFGFKTLEKSYLIKINNKTAERPQHMLMRVSVGIHKKDIKSAIKTYNLLSKKYFTHSTPTLFSSGMPKPYLSSCFLLQMESDSINGIYNTLKKCAKISQYAGGIGLNIHNIRSTGSYIRGTNGVSNGIVPMLRNFDMTARYVDQGGGKRKGSFAIYLEPWHADIFDFLELKKNHGKEELRARDLFYALWIPDIFMKRVKEDGKWSLFCPSEVKSLSNYYGKKFEEIYK